VDAGAPSAEGPRTTASRQSTSFTTYPPLRMVDDDCARGLDGCVPGGVLWVWFNNPLDEAAFDPATVVVAPELEDASVVASGTGLSIYGDTRAETRYTVTIPAALTDTFGQQLGKDRTVHFEVGHAHRSLRGPDQEYVVLDPSAPPAISVYSTNHESVELRVYAVEPSDWPAVSTWMRESRYHHSTVRPPPFQQLASRTVPIELYEPDELIETALDLSPWLDKGHLFVWIQPTLQSKEPWERIDLYAWVQRTELGLTALVDEDEVLVWATSLADGTPLPGVEVSLLGRDGTEPTDTRGLARLEPYAEGHSGPHGVVAERSGDRALLPENTH